MGSFQPMWILIYDCRSSRWSFSSLFNDGRSFRRIFSLRFEIRSMNVERTWISVDLPSFHQSSSKRESNQFQPRSSSTREKQWFDSLHWICATRKTNPLILIFNSKREKNGRRLKKIKHVLLHETVDIRIDGRKFLWNDPNWFVRCWFFYRSVEKINELSIDEAFNERNNHAPNERWIDLLLF